MKIKIKINQMKCEHCAAAVEKALRSIGYENATVDLDGKCADIICATNDIDINAIVNAVTDAGFDTNQIIYDIK